MEDIKWIGRWESSHSIGYFERNDPVEVREQVSKTVEGIANAGDGDDSDDEHEVVEVKILNHERGEIVET